MNRRNTSRAQQPESLQPSRAPSRKSLDSLEIKGGSRTSSGSSAVRGRDEDRESTGEAASRRGREAFAEDSSVRVEAEGEAALREAILDDLEVDEWEEESTPRLRLEEDDGGSVSPEELGEQFLRGATQQERHTKPDDTEPTGDFDASSDSMRQASLFDSDHEPLVDERFPRATASETSRRRVDLRPLGRDSSAAPEPAAPRPPPSPRRKTVHR